MDKTGYLSVKKASEFTSLSTRLLYSLIAQKQLRHFKVGRRIVLKLEDLETYMMNHAVETRDWDEEAKRLR